MRLLNVLCVLILSVAFPGWAMANGVSDLLTKPASFVAYLTTQQFSRTQGSGSSGQPSGPPAFAQTGSRSRLASLIVPPANAVQGEVRAVQNQGGFSYLDTIRNREQAAGKGCVTKNNMFLSEVPLEAIFPIVVGGLLDIGEKKEDNKSNRESFGGNEASSDDGYFGYTRPVGGKEAWYGLWSDVGLYVGFWEPLAIAESVEQPFCFPGSSLMNTVLSTTGAIGDSIVNTYSAPDGGDGNGAGFLYSHWYMTPEMTLLFGVLSNLGIRCSTVGGVGNVDLGFTNFDMVKGAPIIYLSELDPTWENDSLAMLQLENPYHALYHVATAVLPMLSQPMCKVDCQSSNGQGLEGELRQNYGKSGLLYRHCAGCQGYLYPLSGHTKLTGRNAAHLIVQRMMTKLSYSTWVSLAIRPGSQVGGRLETASGKPAMCKACAGPKGQERTGETYVLKEGVFSGFLKKSDFKLMMLSPQNEMDRPCVDDANTSDKGRCADKRYFVPLGRSVDAREKDLLLKKTDSIPASSGSTSTNTGGGPAAAGSSSVDVARTAACLESSFASRSGTNSGPRQNTTVVSETAIPPDWVIDGPPDNTQLFTESGRLITHYVRRYGPQNEARWILAGLSPDERNFHMLSPPLSSGAILYTSIPGRIASPGQVNGRSPAYVWYSGNSQPTPYQISSVQSQEVIGGSGKSVGDIMKSLATCTGVDLTQVAGQLLHAFVEEFSSQASAAGSGSALSETADVAKIIQSWIKTIAPFIGLSSVSGNVNRVQQATSPVPRNANDAGLAMQDQKTATEQSMGVQLLRPNFAFAVTRKRNCCDPMAPYPFDHAMGNDNDQHDIVTKIAIMSTGVVTVFGNNCQLFNPVALGVFAVDLARYQIAPIGDPPKFNWAYLDTFSGSLAPHCVLSLTKSCSNEAKTLITTKPLADAILNSIVKITDILEP